MFQAKKEDKTPKELSELEISNLPDKEFMVMIMKLLKEPGRKMDEQSENLQVFNRVRKCKEPNRAEEYNS